MDNKKNTKKFLYSIEAISDIKDFIAIQKKISTKQRKKSYFRLILILFIVVILYLFNPNNIASQIALVFMIIFTIANLIRYNVNTNNIYKKNYKIFLDNNDNINIKMCFYDDYLELVGKDFNQIVEYQNIKKIENKKEYICLIGVENEIIMIPKRYCNSELISFINNEIPKKMACFENTEIDKNFNVKKIQLKLKILFILTILSIFFAIILFCFYIAPVIDKLPTDIMRYYCWVFLLWLPIPIISIVLGIKYKKRGFNCKKNIIAGWIVAILLAIVGISSIFVEKKDYNNIYTYKNIVGVDIPQRGKLYEVNLTSEFKNNITKYALFTNKTENQKFYQDIQTNKNWISNEKISDSMWHMLSSTFDLECKMLEHVCYYSVYVKDLNQYNTSITEDGTYYIYAMIYDYSSWYLKIEEYQYTYQK